MSLITKQTEVPLTEASASRYLRRLCLHFSQKVPASCDESGLAGEVNFSIGRCRMTSAAGTLAMQCEADSEANLEEVVAVIDRHFQHLCSKADVTLIWR